MLDIGFQELVLIGVIALLVVGPHRLPKLARTAGIYVGKLQRMVAGVRADVENELRTDEVRRAMQEFAPVNEIKSTVEELKSSVDGAKDSLSSVKDSVEEAQNSLVETSNSIGAEVKSSVEPADGDSDASTVEENVGGDDAHDTVQDGDASPKPADTSIPPLGTGVAQARGGNV